MGYRTWGSVTMMLKDYTKTRMTGWEFFTKVASDELFKHCRVEHKWGDYPCPESNCEYIAYCRTTLNKHARFHFTPKPKTSEFHCSKPGCKQSFKDICQKRIHEYIHDNVLTKCVLVK